jgi:hypothetical protein
MRSKAAVATAVLGLVLAVGVATTAGAQQKKNTLTTRASTARGASTSDQNVKKATATNTRGMTVPAPVKKGGVRTRGGADLCLLHVDNRTALYVDLYIDGNFLGAISPYGDSEGYIGCGSRVFYARALYSDGSYDYWGPTTANVSGPFLWTIR